MERDAGGEEEEEGEEEDGILGRGLKAFST